MAPFLTCHSAAIVKICNYEAVDMQVPLVAALSEEAEDHMKSATAWALGQLGRHTPDHAKAVADTGVLPVLVTLENDTHSTEDLKGKCRKALKAIVAKLTFMPALDALVHRSDPPVLCELA